MSQPNVGRQPVGDPRSAPGGPLVSILTPSFEQGRWLEDNLHSVEAQTYGPIEHVVMDGGSSDGSVEILEKRSRAGLIWASEPDSGQSDAINRAFARSSGAIIGWLNSDDAYWSSDIVAQAVAVFEKWPDVGVVYGHAALVNGEGTLLHVIWAPTFAPSVLRAYDLICQPTVFVRRSVIGRPGFVDRSFDYAMDWELLLHLARRTRFFRLNRILAIDRHHLARKSLTRLDLAAEDQDLIVQRYRIPAVASNPLLHRMTKVVIRLAGLSRVMEAARGSDTVALKVGRAGAIAFRQVAQLRRWMPSGDNDSSATTP
jgi:glycosyltransferase involved in cell wall biosynthesis